MISLWHKAVFVHIPKCGGQSVESAILSDIGLDWKRHRRLMLCAPRPTKPVNWPGPPRLAHLKARDYFELDYVNRDLYDKMYKFAFVRDPFSKIESHWKYKFSNMAFEDFILKRLPKLFQKKHWFFCSQTEYIYGDDNVLLVDDVFKLEDMKNSWKAIQGKCKISAELPHVNKSEQAQPGAWTEEMADSIRTLYAADFANFGYAQATPLPGISVGRPAV